MSKVVYIKCRTRNQTTVQMPVQWTRARANDAAVRQKVVGDMTPVSKLERLG
jgi:hypothetical protein